MSTVKRPPEKSLPNRLEMNCMVITVKPQSTIFGSKGGGGNKRGK